MQDKDDSRVWKAIDWRGNIVASSDVDGDRPNDTEFKQHFESVLVSDENNLDNVNTDVTMPVLDDPITPLEMEHQIRAMKPDKAVDRTGLLRAFFSCSLLNGL